MDELEASLNSLSLSFIEGVSSSQADDIDRISARLGQIEALVLRGDTACVPLQLLQRAADVVNACDTLSKSFLQLDAELISEARIATRDCEVIVTSSLNPEAAVFTPRSQMSDEDDAHGPCTRQPDYMPWRRWFLENIAHPYPNDRAKQSLKKKVPGNVTKKNITGWFTNIRRRSGWNDLYKVYANSQPEAMEALVRSLQDPLLAELADPKARNLFKQVQRFVEFGGKGAPLDHAAFLEVTNGKSRTCGEKAKKRLTGLTSPFQTPRSISSDSSSSSLYSDSSLLTDRSFSSSSSFSSASPTPGSLSLLPPLKMPPVDFSAPPFDLTAPNFAAPALLFPPFDMSTSDPFAAPQDPFAAFQVSPAQMEDNPFLVWPTVPGFDASLFPQFDAPQVDSEALLSI